MLYQDAIKIAWFILIYVCSHLVTRFPFRLMTILVGCLLFGSSVSLTGSPFPNGTILLETSPTDRGGVRCGLLLFLGGPGCRRSAVLSLGGTGRRCGALLPLGDTGGRCGVLFPLGRPGGRCGALLPLGGTGDRPPCLLGGGSFQARKSNEGNFWQAMRSLSLPKYKWLNLPKLLSLFCSLNLKNSARTLQLWRLCVYGCHSTGYGARYATALITVHVMPQHWLQFTDATALVTVHICYSTGYSSQMPQH